MDGKIYTSAGRDAEAVVLATQSTIKTGGVEVFAGMTYRQQYRATNPTNEDDKAEGGVFDLLRAGVPIGPAFVLLALGLNVGESFTAGAVRIERLADVTAH